MSGKVRTLTQFHQPNFRSKGSKKTAVITKKVEEGEGRGWGGRKMEEGEKESQNSLFKNLISIDQIYT